LALGAGLMLFALLISRWAEATVPPLGRFVDVGGTRLHIAEFGQGPPLVLIHGLGAQLRNFTYALVDELKADFRVICVDRPGCGYSARPGRVSASLSGQADTLARLLESLGLEKPVIVGHSFGGAVALALALNHSDKVGAVGLIAPLTHMQTQVPAVFSDLVIPSPILRKLAAWTLAVPGSMVAGAKVMGVVFSPDAMPADFPSRGGGILGVRPGQFYCASSDLVGIVDELPLMMERYSSIRVPVGILFGKSDAILDHEEHGVALQSKVPGASLCLVEGGHMLPIVAPAQTAHWIAEFAGGCAPLNPA
jgi:pimeloyl-ACP methyl ester carboxylesterase